MDKLENILDYLSLKVKKKIIEFTKNNFISNDLEEIRLRTNRNLSLKMRSRN